MAKQTFSVGQVLTASQMQSLQATALGGGSATAKTASYILVAADAGTVVAVNSTSATTITVNTGLFSAGDTVFIQNWGSGTCTVTAGTATVNTHGSLALAQYEGGTLYFTSASAAIFFDISQTSGMTNPMTTAGDTIYGGASGTPTRLAIGSTGNVLTVSGGNPVWAAPAGGGKVLQVVNATYSTETTNSTSTFADTGLTASITPSSATSKVLVIVVQAGIAKSAHNNDGGWKLLKGATDLKTFEIAAPYTNSALTLNPGASGITYLDSPATTSSTTYKTQFKNNVGGTGTITAQYGGSTASITLMEIGA